MSTFPGDQQPPSPGVIMTPRRGSAIQTASGRLFYPRDPQPSEVHIPDYVHATSHLCRYNGHVRRFYSVLEHQVRACDMYLADRGFSGHTDPLLLHMRRDAAIARDVLWHDLHEGVTGDMTTPMKRCLPEFKAQIERPVEAAFAEALGLSQYAEEVKRVDLLIAAAERRDLMPGGPTWPGLPDPPAGYRIPGDDPTHAVLAELVALADHERGSDDHPLLKDVECARRLVDAARAALALHPLTWRDAWNARWEARGRASRPRPCPTTEATAIAACWASQARQRGIAAASALDKVHRLVGLADWASTWRSIAGGTPVEMFLALQGWFEATQALYDACAATADLREGLVQAATRRWVGDGCAPLLRVGARVVSPRGGGVCEVAEWDAECALFRPAGFQSWVAAEEVVPCR